MKNHNYYMCYTTLKLKYLLEKKLSARLAIKVTDPFRTHNCTLKLGINQPTTGSISAPNRMASSSMLFDIPSSVTIDDVTTTAVILPITPTGTI